MKVYDMKRGAGKTTYLIYLSNLLKIPILCHGAAHSEAIKQRARAMGLEIPDPIYVGKLRGYKPDAVLIDELEFVLQGLLNKDGLNTKVIAATYSSNPNDISDINEEIKHNYINKAYNEIKNAASSEGHTLDYDKLINIFNKICVIINNTENEIKELI